MEEGDWLALCRDHNPFVGFMAGRDLGLKWIRPVVAVPRQARFGMRFGTRFPFRVVRPKEKRKLRGGARITSV